MEMTAAAIETLAAQVREHLDCDDQFCRNGTAEGEKLVHPGPCRGWKEALRRNAPGVHRALEQVRQERVAQRRAERESARMTGAGARAGDEVRIINSGSERRADAGRIARVTSRDLNQVHVEYPDGGQPRTDVISDRNLEVVRTVDQMEAGDRSGQDARDAAHERMLAETRGRVTPARGATPNRGQLTAIETVGRSGTAGLHLSRLSPTMRRNLIEGGWAEERTTRSADGRDRPALFLTDRGRGIADARQSARDQATRRIEEQAVAEGLDPVEAKLGGLAHARQQRALREEAEVRARRP
jgi:hypothetical protein